MDGPYLLDLGDVEGFENRQEVEKLWTMLLLTAIREGGTFVCLRRMNGNESLWLYANERWHEMVPPPVDLGPKMREAILARGGDGLDERSGADPPRESRFRLRLGLGFKEVRARETSIDGRTELILALTDVTIPSFDAEEVLKQHIERRKRARDGGDGSNDGTDG